MENETPSEKIKFKPLHEGMGFHPFSDGLPYAPASKTQQTPKRASGAVSAGRPQFTAQPFTQPLPKPFHQPTAQPLHAQLNFNPSALAQENLSAQNYNSKNISLDKAVLRNRVFAYLLDAVIHAGFWLLTNLAAFFIFKFQIEVAIFAENISQFVGFFLLSQWLFIALQEMLFETTLGKAFFNLEFKRNHGSLLFRSVVFMAGVLFFGLGLYFRPQDRFGEVTLKSKIES